MSKVDKVLNEEKIKERIKKDIPLWYYEDKWIRRKKLSFIEMNN